MEGEARGTACLAESTGSQDTVVPVLALLLSLVWPLVKNPSLLGEIKRPESQRVKQLTKSIDMPATYDLRDRFNILRAPTAHLTPLLRALIKSLGLLLKKQKRTKTPHHVSVYGIYAGHSVFTSTGTCVLFPLYSGGEIKRLESESPAHT